ncbi:MAG: Gfo/Idh/MocA family oxidoreductase [Lachnospiraceae bacterium]|nr:Gfo/Idh/MocA family oxidoreductase [Candidatus Colinaster scatohippi]
MKIKNKFGFEKGYTDYDALLSDKDVEAVYIPLPNQLHYEWVMKAIEAGKNVLCEKPLAPTAAQVEELFEAAERKGVLLMEAFAYLHTPYIAALKDEVNNKTFGDVRYIEAAFLTSDYNLTNIRMQKDCYGGATYDLGCYCTSIILRMLDREPVTVQGVAEYSEQNVDVLTTVNVLQNYRLEVEQFGRCITDGEKPHVSREFSAMNARTLDKVLAAIEYN